MAWQGATTWFDEGARRQAVAKSNAFVETQAARLGVRPADILAAVTRGWTAAEIEVLPVADAARLLV